MTDIDIDAIRQLVKHHASAIGPGGDKAWTASQLAAKVPALLAKVDELTAELSKVREDRNNWVMAWTTANRDLDRSRERAATLANEIGRLTAENARVRQQRDEALAKLEHFRVEVTNISKVRHRAPNGCDDCSVEPGERHRYLECPGNLRAIERAKAEAVR